MLLRATGGSPLGAAVLAAIARKESSFGANAFVPNNYWGYGIHAGPSVNRAPSVEAMARRVWNALKDPKGYYLGEGRKTLPDILMKYAPPSENDTELYKRQTAQWMREMGFDPNVNVFTGARVPVGPGGTPAGGGAAPSGTPMPQTAPAAINLDWNKLNSIFRKNQADILAGRQPDPKRMNELLRTVMSALPVAGPQVADIAGTPTPRKPRGAGPVPGAGGVPRGAGIYTTPYGEWGGTAGPVQALQRLSGLTVTSAKRERKYTKSGGVSDHYVGNRNAYANDLSFGSSSPNAKGDAAASKIVAALGGPANWGKRGGVFNTTINGIRFQVLYRTNVGGNHYNHIHVGARRV
jgi:hypothetical protein